MDIQCQKPENRASSTGKKKKKKLLPIEFINVIRYRRQTSMEYRRKYVFRPIFTIPTKKIEEKSASKTDNVVQT